MTRVIWVMTYMQLCMLCQRCWPGKQVVLIGFMSKRVIINVLQAGLVDWIMGLSGIFHMQKRYINEKKNTKYKNKNK